MKIKPKHIKLWDTVLKFSSLPLPAIEHKQAMLAFFELESHGRILTPITMESQALLDAALVGKSFLGWHLKSWGEDLRDRLLTEQEIEEIINEFDLGPSHIAAIRKGA